MREAAGTTRSTGSPVAMGDIQIIRAADLRVGDLVMSTQSPGWSWLILGEIEEIGREVDVRALTLCFHADYPMAITKVKTIITGCYLVSRCGE